MDSKIIESEVRKRNRYQYQNSLRLALPEKAAYLEKHVLTAQSKAGIP